MVCRRRRLLGGPLAEDLECRFFARLLRGLGKGLALLELPTRLFSISLPVSLNLFTADRLTFFPSRASPAIRPTVDRPLFTRLFAPDFRSGATDLKRPLNTDPTP